MATRSTYTGSLADADPAVVSHTASEVHRLMNELDKLANEAYATDLGYAVIGKLHGRDLSVYQALATAHRYLGIADLGFTNAQGEEVNENGIRSA